MYDEAALSAALRAVPDVRVSGPFFRAVAATLLLPAVGVTHPQILTGVYAREHGGRYNAPKTFATTYLAMDAVTALAEAGGVYVASGVVARTILDRPYTVLAIQGDITHALDLTDPGVQTRLGITNAQLLEPWRAYQLRGEEAPTQQLGRLIRATGRFEAFVVPSEKHHEGRALVVFADRVSPPSGLSLVDPDWVWREQLP